jgi:hypothetical protein
MAAVSRLNFIVLAIIAAASLFANLVLFWHYVNEPPFVLIMKPATDGGATVQFIQPHDHDGRTSASPEFHVDVELKGPFVESLDSANVAIPGAVVELGDVTLLPGAFHIKFGDDVFYVMSSRVHLKGVDYAWAAANGGVAVVGAESRIP